MEVHHGCIRYENCRERRAASGERGGGESEEWRARSSKDASAISGPSWLYRDYHASSRIKKLCRILVQLWTKLEWQEASVPPYVPKGASRC